MSTEDAESAEVDGTAVQADREPPKATINRTRSIVGGIIAIAFLAIVFTRVIPQIGDYQGAFEAIADLTFINLLTLVAALIVYLLIYGLPYLVAAPSINFRESEIVNNSRFAIGNGIPGGGALGLAVQYAQLTLYRASPTEATAAIGATGVWATFITLTLPVTGVAAFLMSGGEIGRFLLPALAALGVLITAVILFALILRSEQNAHRIGAFADRIVAAILGRFKPGMRVNITGQVLQLRRDIVDLVSRRWLAITAANFGVSFGQFMILAVALHAVAKSPENINYLAVYGSWAVSQLGILLPITPGGLGTVDAALIALMTAQAGVSDADATAAALVWRATYYFPQILIGIICIFIWRWQAERARKKSLAT